MWIWQKLWKWDEYVWSLGIYILVIIKHRLRPSVFVIEIVVIVQSLSHVWLLVIPWISRFPGPLLSPGVCSNSYPVSQSCHPTISSSIAPFSSYPQSSPLSESFPMSWLFASCGQSVRALASASVLPMNIQGWFPLGLTGWISLQSKGLLSNVFSKTVWKHQFFGAQPSLGSTSHIYKWLLEKP